MKVHQRLGLTIAALVLLVIGGIAGVTLAGGGDTAGGDVLAYGTEQLDRGIHVDGEGQIALTPDIAYVNLGVQIEGEEVDDLREEANTSMDDVIEAIKDAGIPESDIRTITYDISVKRDWEHRGQPIVGYVLTHMIEVKVTDIDEVGTIIDVALDNGANSVGNIRFEVEDRAGAIRDARELAMQDALDKAEHLAELGGVSLGSPIRISESSPSLPPVYYDEMVAADMDMAEEGVARAPIQPGESIVTVYVNVVYAIN